MNIRAITITLFLFVKEVFQYWLIHSTYGCHGYWCL